MAHTAGDPRRLARAVFLDVERVGPDTWRVTGGSTPHTVAPTGCDCPDFMVRRLDCKHILAVRLRKGDEPTIRALRTIVSHPVQPNAHTKNLGTIEAQSR